MQGLLNGFGVCLRLWAYVVPGMLTILLASKTVIDAYLRLGTIPSDIVWSAALFASGTNLMLWVISYMCVSAMSVPGISRRAHRLFGAAIAAAFIVSYAGVAAL